MLGRVGAHHLGLIHQSAPLHLEVLLKLLNVLWYPGLLALRVMLGRVRAHHPGPGLQERQGAADSRDMGLAEELAPGEAEETTESWHDESSQISCRSESSNI